MDVNLPHTCPVYHDWPPPVRPKGDYGISMPERVPVMAHTLAQAQPLAVLPEQVSEMADIQDFSALLQDVADTQSKPAFIALFNYFAPRIKSYMMKGGAAPDKAEELAQETMLTVWQKAALFDKSQSVASTWIFTIARNRRIDALRRDGRMVNMAEDAAFEAVMPAHDPKDGEWLAIDGPKVTRALEALPEAQAQLVKLSYFENLSHADIAARTRLPLGTIKSRLRLALSKMRDTLNTKPATYPTTTKAGQGL